MQHLKISISIFISLIFFKSNLFAQQYVQIWSDEFNSPQLNSANWTPEIGTGFNGWGNNELQYYTSRPENLLIQNGNLMIIGKKEAYQGSDYTSARIKTQSKQYWKYGKMEARIKMPKAQGLWPACWMLGESITSQSWPNCGEIDIMEHINSDNKVFGTMHWDANGHAYYGGDTNINDVSLFHIYSVEWDSSKITWFVDGNKYWEANILNNINSTEEFHAPFFILLNMAIGGNFPGNPTSTSISEDTLFVDYVKVYQRQQAPARISNYQEKKELQINPNPVRANQAFTIQFKKTGLYEVELVDFMGRVLLYKKIDVRNLYDPVILKVDHLTIGCYVLRARNGYQALSDILAVIN